MENGKNLNRKPSRAQGKTFENERPPNGKWWHKMLMKNKKGERRLSKMKLASLQY